MHVLHGSQENVASTEIVGRTSFPPLFAFSSDVYCLVAELRRDNVHSGEGVVEFHDPNVTQHETRFGLF